MNKFKKTTIATLLSALTSGVAFSESSQLTTEQKVSTLAYALGQTVLGIKRSSEKQIEKDKQQDKSIEDLKTLLQGDSNADKDTLIGKGHCLV